MADVETNLEDLDTTTDTVEDLDTTPEDKEEEAIEEEEG